MNVNQLSKRLMTVAKYIPVGSRLADIGSDHAYLPCYVAKKKIVPFAIAGEVVEGPFQSAKKQVLKEGLEEIIHVRKGDGLEVIDYGEVDVITICGMGGSLITKILEEGKGKLAKVTRLILQPNVGAISIRKWLLENDWELIQEEILEEDGKIYEILVAERGNPEKPYIDVEKKAALLLGPFLMKEKKAPFQKKWIGEVTTWKKILKQLEMAQSEDKQCKEKELLEKIHLVEEALKG